MIVDLHTHTKEHSPCGQHTAEELILRAMAVGLDGIVITDHDYLWNSAELEGVLEGLGKPPIVVLRGREVSCPDGHLLVYGIEGTLPEAMPRAALASWVRQHGGATILAHPFRWGGFADIPAGEIASYFQRFDAVEAWTTNHSPSDRARASRFRDVGIRVVGASDAHTSDRVGLFATHLETTLCSEADLVRSLRDDLPHGMIRNEGGYHAVA